MNSILLDQVRGPQREVPEREGQHLWRSSNYAGVHHSNVLSLACVSEACGGERGIFPVDLPLEDLAAKSASILAGVGRYQHSQENFTDHCRVHSFALPRLAIRAAEEGMERWTQPGPKSHSGTLCWIMSSQDFASILSKLAEISQRCTIIGGPRLFHFERLPSSRSRRARG